MSPFAIADKIGSLSIRFIVLDIAPTRPGKAGKQRKKEERKEDLNSQVRKVSKVLKKPAGQVQFFEQHLQNDFTNPILNIFKRRIKISFGANE